MGKLIGILLLVSCGFVRAQYNGRNFSVGADFVYTTSSKIYLYPYSSDNFLRNKAFPIDDILNPAVNFRYRLNDDILLELNIEYMTKTIIGKDLTVFSENQTLTINVEDGFEMIPVELSIYYVLPFSTERWKFLMGGGGAYYYGTQIRKFGDETVKSKPKSIAYGIQVSISAEYMILQNFGVRSAMKFRDPQFTSENNYTKNEINYNGKIITIAQNSFVSKINVDGVTFMIGFIYSF